MINNVNFHGKNALKILRENYEDARLYNANFLFIRGEYTKAKTLLEKPFCYAACNEEERQRILGLINKSPAKKTDKSINNAEQKIAKIENNQPRGPSKAKLNELIERRQQKKTTRREITKWEVAPEILKSSGMAKASSAETITTTTSATTTSSNAKRKAREAVDFQKKGGLSLSKKMKESPEKLASNS